MALHAGEWITYRPISRRQVPQLSSACGRGHGVGDLADAGMSSSEYLRSSVGSRRDYRDCSFPGEVVLVLASTCRRRHFIYFLD